MKILVIEDDQLVADALVELLVSQPHVVEVAADGETGWSLLKAYEYDLVILDLTLPQVDGISLCREMRSQGLSMPVLMLTGRDDRHDKAIGLDAGADDYVVKPFEPEELLARVRALLRRSGEPIQTVLSWGALQLDPNSCHVTYGDRLIALTPKEYALTELFLRHPKRVFSCGAILDHLWAYEEAPGEEAVRTHIKGLRQKLKAADAANDMVETVYGIGYRLRLKEMPVPEIPTVSSADCPVTVSPSRPVRPVPDAQAVAQEEAIRLKIQQIWHQAQGRVQAQLDVIQQLLTAIAEGAIATPDLWQAARREAHSLAGSLGTFGFTQGSQLAKKIEVSLNQTVDSSGRLAELAADLMALRQELHPLAGAVTEGVTEGIAQAAPDRSVELRLIAPIQPTAVQHQAVSAPRPTLLVIDPDTQLMRALLKNSELKNSDLHKFEIEVAKNLDRAQEKIQYQVPQVILFDPDVAVDLAESLRFLNQLNQHLPPIPTVIFTVRTELLDRRNLLRSGGSVLLPKPADLDQVAEAIRQAIARSEQSRSHVLIVDDDPMILTLTQQLLQPWGLKVTSLADPKQFWQVLEASQPDLLVLDVVMPDVDGMDLCQVVRGDVRWSELPIVVLTACQDAAMINRLFSLGADDIVSKPIVGPELVTRIINRLERTQVIQRRHQLASHSQSSAGAIAEGTQSPIAAPSPPPCRSAKTAYAP